jgi:hypothetical protein
LSLFLWPIGSTTPFCIMTMKRGTQKSEGIGQCTTKTSESFLPSKNLALCLKSAVIVHVGGRLLDEEFVKPLEILKTFLCGCSPPLLMTSEAFVTSDSFSEDTLAISANITSFTTVQFLSSRFLLIQMRSGHLQKNRPPKLIANSQCCDSLLMHATNDSKPISSAMQSPLKPDL